MSMIINPYVFATGAKGALAAGTAYIAGEGKRVWEGIGSVEASAASALCTGGVIGGAIRAQDAVQAGEGFVTHYGVGELEAQDAVVGGENLAAFFLESVFALADDQTLVDEQVISTPADGVKTGALAATIGSLGDISFVSGKLVMDGYFDWHNTIIDFPAHVATMQGVAAFAKLSVPDNLCLHSFGFSDSFGSSASNMDIVLSLVFQLDGTLSCYYGEGTGITVPKLQEVDNIGTYSVDTDYEVCLVVGGYDDFWIDNPGVYEAGELPVRYIKGGSVFIKEGAGEWQLLFRAPEGIRNSQGPMNLALKAHTNIVEYEYVSLPDTNLFEMANIGHTEQPVLTGDTFTHAADCYIEYMADYGILGNLDVEFRRTDDNNKWISRRNHEDEILLIEVVAGVEEVHAQLLPITAGEWSVKIVAVGETIDIFTDDTRVIHHTGAVSNKTATSGKVAFVSWDVFYLIARPRGLLGEYAAFDDLGLFNRFPVAETLNNVLMWFDAADELTLYQDTDATIIADTEGDPVGAWLNKARRTDAFRVIKPVGADYPTFNEDFMNSIPAVRGEGTSWLETADGNENSAFSGQGSVSIIVVYRAIPNHGTEAAILGFNGDNLLHNGMNISSNDDSSEPYYNAMSILISNTDLPTPLDAVSDNQDFPTGFVNVAQFDFGYDDSDDLVMYRDGVQVYTQAFAANRPDTGNTYEMQIFAAGNGANPFTGDICEIIMKEGILTEAERLNLSDWLMRKWLPPPGPYFHDGTGDVAALPAAVESVGMLSDTGLLQAADSSMSGDGELVGELGVPQTLSGLELWLDSDDLTTLFQDAAGQTPVTANTDPVGLWKDKSGESSRDFSQSVAGDKVLYNTGAQNGLPALRGYGSDRLSNQNNAAWKFLSDGSPSSIFMVVRTEYLSYENDLIGNVSGAPGFALYMHGSNDDQLTALVVDDADDVVIYKASAIGDFWEDSWLIIQFDQKDGATGDDAQMYNLGVLQAGAEPLRSYGTATPADQLSIFANGDSSWALNGHIGEVIIYSQRLSSTDRATITTYLSDKWDIT